MSYKVGDILRRNHSEGHSTIPSVDFLQITSVNEKTAFVRYGGVSHYLDDLELSFRHLDFYFELSSEEEYLIYKMANDHGQ
jgi:hypothetical protein